MVHVPYNGGGPALASILAGVTEVWIAVYNRQALVDEGKLVGLAVTSAERIPYPGDADGCRNAARLRGDDVVRLLIFQPARRVVRDKLRSAVTQAIGMAETRSVLRTRV
jgi:hypothetical protein